MELSDKVSSTSPSASAPPMSLHILWRELRLTFALGIPIILATVGNMMMGVVNTIVVGRVSAEALAGVAAGNALFWPIAMGGLGLMHGLDTVISRASGEKNWRECDQALGQCLLVWLVASLVMTPLIYFASDYYALTGARAEVVTHAVPYLKVMSYNYGPLLFFYAFQRYWQAQGVVTVLTVIILLANIVNYFFAVGFVWGSFGFPALGSAGVGYANLLCRLFCDLAILLFSLRLWRTRAAKTGVAIMRRDFFRFRKDLMSRLIRLGLPSSGQITLEIGAFALTTTVVAGLGAEPLAAHQIVLVMASFTYMFPLGLSSASAVRVGSLIGSSRYSEARRAGWIGICAGASIMALFGLAMCLFPSFLLGLFSKEQPVIELGMGIIFLAAIFQVFDGIQVVTTGALRGAGNTKFAFFSNLIGYYAIGLPLGFFLCFTFSWHIRGLWLGLATGLIITAIANTFFWWNYGLGGDASEKIRG